VAGLQMIPLVAVIMAGAMGSGIAISKTGRYKAFPLVGIVFIVIALVSMSFVIDAHTSVWTLVPFMVLLGVGLGFNFQPVILAVQNAVNPREMGVATSSVTFFRQMGGTIGVAVFLSILFTRLATEIPKQIIAAAQANPAVAQQAQQLRQAGASSVLSDTSGIHAYPALVEPFNVGFSNVISLVFLVAAAVVAIGFFVLWFLPEVPLRNQSGIQAQQEAAAEQAAAAGAVPPAVERTREEEAANAVGAAAPTSTPPPAGKPKDPQA
jgi:hypothetical protein